MAKKSEEEREELRIKLQSELEEQLRLMEEKCRRNEAELWQKKVEEL